MSNRPVILRHIHLGNDLTTCALIAEVPGEMSPNPHTGQLEATKFHRQMPTGDLSETSIQRFTDDVAEQVERINLLRAKFCGSPNVLLFPGSALPGLPEGTKH